MRFVIFLIVPLNRPPSTAVPTPGDDCYNIVHRRERWENQPTDPEVVARCEEKLRCVGYIADKKQDIEVAFDEGCEALYQAEADAWKKQMEEAMLPSPAWHPNDPREHRPNTPQQHPNISLGVNLGNGQQQFPAMRQPVLFSNPSAPLQP